jgi:HK97 family phage portal protein
MASFLQRFLSPKTENRSNTPEIKIVYPDSPASQDDIIISSDPLQISWVYAATNLRASTISSLPLNLYRKLDDGDSEPANDHYISKLLRTGPYKGNEMSIADWLHFGMLNFDLQGNAFYQIVRNVGGRVVELIPINSSVVTVNRVGGELVYNVHGVKMTANNILHIRNYSTDGLVGRSVVEFAKQSLLNTARLDSVSYRINANAVRPSATFTTDQALNEKQVAQLTAAINGKKQGEPLVLSNGMKWDDRKISMSAEDSQFLQTLNYRATEICALFGVPAYKLGLTGERKPGSSVEQDNLDWVSTTIRPLCNRWEKAMNLRLLSDAEQENYFFKFDLGSLLSGDQKTQAESYTKLVQTGVMTVNECRKKFGLPKISNGDTLLQPLNTNNVKAEDTDKIVDGAPVKVEKVNEKPSADVPVNVAQNMPA